MLLPAPCSVVGMLSRLLMQRREGGLCIRCALCNHSRPISLVPRYYPGRWIYVLHPLISVNTFAIRYLAFATLSEDYLQKVTHFMCAIVEIFDSTGIGSVLAA